MEKENNQEKKKIKHKKLKIFGIIFVISILLLSLALSAGYNEKKSKILQNQLNEIKQQVEEQSNQSVVVQDVKKPDPSIHNPLTAINPRYSFVNISQDEIAFIAHDGTMGAVGNITLRTANEGYGFFNYLGDSANRILQGFFNNLDISSTTNSSQFFQNGNLVIDSVSSVWNQSGTNAFLNNPANKVGIGTSTPTGTLDVVYNGLLASGVPVARIYSSLNNAGVVGDVLQVQAQRGDTNSYNLINVSNQAGTKFLISGNGNVGIGTTSPSQPLEVNGKTRMGQWLEFYNGSSIQGYIGYGSAGSLFTDGLADGLDIRGTNSVQLGVGTNSYLTILSTGKIGVGTTNPLYGLYVSGASPQFGVNSTFTVDGQMRFDSDSVLSSMIYRPGSTSDMRFYLGGDKMTINGSTGNIGIGTIKPTQKLEVAGSIFANGGSFNLNGTIDGTGYSLSNTSNILRWVIRGTTAETGLNKGYSLNFASRADDGTALNNVLTLQRNGSVGIGTANPTGLLQVSRGAGQNVFADWASPNFGVSISAYTSGTWARSYNFFNESSGSVLGGFGAYGRANVTDYYYIGAAYNSAIAVFNQTSGNVGIGTSGPTENLEVNGTFKVRSADSVKNIKFNASDGSIQTSAVNLFLQSIANKVGIGMSTTPDSLLSINGNMSVNNTLFVNNNGKVGIGTATPSQTLDVRGIGNFSGTVYINNATDISTLGGGSPMVLLQNINAVTKNSVYLNDTGQNWTTYPYIKIFYNFQTGTGALRVNLSLNNIQSGGGCYSFRTNDGATLTQRSNVDQIALSGPIFSTEGFAGELMIPTSSSTARFGIVGGSAGIQAEETLMGAAFYCAGNTTIKNLNISMLSTSTFSGNISLYGIK